MCFSASVSFGAAAVLFVIGVFTVKANTRQEWFLFALVPLLFAVQQFAEGVLWVALGSGGLPVVEAVAMAVFLGFAIVGWPPYMAWAVYRLEPQGFRKRLLKWFLGAGLVWVAASLVYFIVFPPSAAAMDGHIQYTTTAPSAWEWVYTPLYAILAFTPFFLTSRRDLWVFSGLVGVTGLATFLLWSTYFVSLWCFFAAVSSLAVCYIIHRHNTA